MKSKVKIFTSESIKDLENKVNEFLNPKDAFLNTISIHFTETIESWSVLIHYT